MKKHVFGMDIYFKKQDNNKLKNSESTLLQRVEDGIREENISLFNNPGDVLILLLDFGIIRIHCITMLYNFDI